MQLCLIFNELLVQILALTKVVTDETVVPIKDNQCLEIMLNHASRIIMHIIMKGNSDRK